MGVTLRRRAHDLISLSFGGCGRRRGVLARRPHCESSHVPRSGGFRRLFLPTFAPHARAWESDTGCASHA